MDKSWYEVTVAIGAIAMPIVTVLGFFFVYLQIRQAAKSIKSEAASQLYGLALRLNEMLVAYPEMRKYIYERSAPPKEEPERTRVLIMCEIFCDFFEYILAEEGVIEDNVRLPWLDMMKATIAQSPCVREFFDERRTQYTKDFGKHFDAACRAARRAA